MKYTNAYSELTIMMKAGGKAKYEGYCKQLEEALHGLVGDPKEKGVFIKFIPEDDKITVKAFANIPEMIEIPDDLKDGLKDIDQYVKVRAVLGVDAEELLTSDKSLVEQAMKGFSFSAELVFLKNLKKALMKGFEDGSGPLEELKGMLQMGGPAFAFSSNTSVELTFDDFEELKEHPMGGQLLLSLDQLTTGML